MERARLGKRKIIDKFHNDFMFCDRANTRSSFLRGGCISPYFGYLLARLHMKLAIKTRWALGIFYTLTLASIFLILLGITCYSRWGL